MSEVVDRKCSIKKCFLPCFVALIRLPWFYFWFYIIISNFLFVAFHLRSFENVMIIVKVVKNKDSTLRRFVDSVLFWSVLRTGYTDKWINWICYIVKHTINLSICLVIVIVLIFLFFSFLARGETRGIRLGHSYWLQIWSGLPHVIFPLFNYPSLTLEI